MRVWSNSKPSVSINSSLASSSDRATRPMWSMRRIMGPLLGGPSASVRTGRVRRPGHNVLVGRLSSARGAPSMWPVTSQRKAAMLESLVPGLENTKTFPITEDMCTGHTGTPVLSTPSMIGLMEGTCLESAQEHLGETEVTVGIHVCVSHVAGSQLGEEVTVRSQAGRDRARPVPHLRGVGRRRRPRARRGHAQAGRPRHRPDEEVDARDPPPARCGGCTRSRARATRATRRSRSVSTHPDSANSSYTSSTDHMYADRYSAAVVASWW